MNAHGIRVLLIGMFAMGLPHVLGCFATPRVETTIHESPQGAVSLKEFSDPSVRADHPVSLEPSLLSKTLSGVHVQERKTIVESVLTGAIPFVRVFTDEQVHFLAPLLQSALSQATPEEQVLFSLTGEMSGRQLVTEGSLYASRGNLYLALTSYGLQPQQPATLSRPSHSFDRPKRWALMFQPEAALLNRDEDIQVSLDESQPNRLTISLAFLKQYPLRATEEIRRDKQVEAMEEELHQLRQSLEQQQDKLDRLERELAP